MEIYLVGGAVRDALLNRPVTERDWVVVGSSPEELTGLGYKSVGKDFPVFLHPDSKEEYALARTERKTAKGYHGFQFYTADDVTLEQDLARRDLTINAIAQSSSGDLIDPYLGLADIKAKKLRHVSNAFAEDPVRILRTARFAARYAHLGFTVADETIAVMTEMVNSGEVDALVSERVWQELTRALQEHTPDVFFQVLRACGALAVLLPEVEALFGVPQNSKHHPEIDTGLHTMLVLQQCVTLNADNKTRFAALCHDLGKAETPENLLPSHPGHEETSARLCEVICKRFKAPRKYRDLAVLVARYHTDCHRAMELKSSTLLKVLGAMDVTRKPNRFERFLTACEADARGRTDHENAPYPQADFLRGAFRAMSSINPRHVIKEGSTGIEIKEALREKQLEAIKNYKLSQQKQAS